MNIKFLPQIKELQNNQQGLVSPMALVLVLICLVAVTYVLRLEQEHQANWEFALNKIKMQNTIISTANENRHQLYTYYQGGNIMPYPQEQYVEMVPEAINPHNKEIIHFALWRQYSRYYRAEGGKWTYIMADERIIPKLYWSYEVEQGRVARSLWNKY